VGLSVGQADEGARRPESPKPLDGALRKAEPRGTPGSPHDLDLSFGDFQEPGCGPLRRKARREAPRGVALREGVGPLAEGEGGGALLPEEPLHLADLHDLERLPDNAILHGSQCSAGESLLPGYDPRMKDALKTASVPSFQKIPGLVHGFERRIGPPGWETREASRARVRATLEDYGRLLFLRQVHGNRIATAPWPEPPEADGGISGEEGVLLAIETADCLPIFLVDPRRRMAAAVHAGWRGTAHGVVARAVQALNERGSRAEDIRAALGPAIGPCCYEVGDEVRGAFGEDASACFSPGPHGKLHFDLRRANRLQLLAEGLSPGAIHDVPDCTFCHADLYHSYRRDGAGSGRMVNFLGYGAIGAWTP
jgi:YfiH family protein